MLGSSVRPSSPRSTPLQPPWHCHWCGRRLPRLRALGLPAQRTMTAPAMIPPELEAEILRSPRREVALRHHRPAAARASRHRAARARAGRGRRAARPPTLEVEPYLPFILETLEKYPTLTRLPPLRDGARARLPGGPDHFRRVIARLRPRPAAEAYLRLRTLPGEQGQVDWGHFGKSHRSAARAAAWAFVMVLSATRARSSCASSSSVDGELPARARRGLRFFGGVAAHAALRQSQECRARAPRRRDPLPSDAARARRSLPLRAAPRGRRARQREGARRARHPLCTRRFFAARTFTDLADLNAQAAAWCDGHRRRAALSGGSQRTVRQVFADEQPHLLASARQPVSRDERLDVDVGKTPYVRFDLNDYSIPHTHVRRTLTRRCRSRHGAHRRRHTTWSQRHLRCWDRGAQIEDRRAHRALVAHKRAPAAIGLDRLAVRRRRATPCSRSPPSAAPISAASPPRCCSCSTRYGAAELEAAIVEALARTSPTSVPCADPRAAPQERRPPPPIAVALPEDRARDRARHPPTALATYDQLKETDPMTTALDPLQARAERRSAVSGLLAHWDEIERRALAPQSSTSRSPSAPRRSLERRLPEAHIGRFKSMADFDWSWPKDRPRGIEELSHPRLPQRGANVVLVGPNGVGKTMIPKPRPPGDPPRPHRALRHRQRHARRPRRPGDRPSPAPAATPLQPARSCSASTRSAISPTTAATPTCSSRSSPAATSTGTLLTTNKAFAEWSEVFPHAACVVTLVDRLIHRAEIIDIEAESYRLKEAKERAEQRARKRRRAKSAT